MHHYTSIFAWPVPPSWRCSCPGRCSCARLSSGLQGLLRALRGVSSSAKADVSRTREDRIASSPGRDASKVFEAVHPVVRTHPETPVPGCEHGAHRALRRHDRRESAPLLDYLFRHQTDPEFTCRFRWQVGSIGFRDNSCTLHNPINDYHGHRRRMLRITLAGDTPA